MRQECTVGKTKVNKMNIVKKLAIKIIILVTIVVVVVLLTAPAIFDNELSAINSNHITYYSMLVVLLTFIGTVLWTLYSDKRKQKFEKEMLFKKTRADYMPALKYEYNIDKRNNGGTLHYVECDDSYKDTDNIQVNICVKNSGRNIAKNISFKLAIDGEHIQETSIYGKETLATDEEVEVSFYFTLPKVENVTKHERERFSKNLVVAVLYSDLLGNRYYQEIKGNLIIGTHYDVVFMGLEQYCLLSEDEEYCVSNNDTLHRIDREKIDKKYRDYEKHYENPLLTKFHEILNTDKSMDEIREFPKKQIKNYNDMCSCGGIEYYKKINEDIYHLIYENNTGNEEGSKKLIFHVTFETDITKGTSRIIATDVYKNTLQKSKIKKWWFKVKLDRFKKKR